MENIYNNYRNIIERAVLSGIITEENRDFYLSAIGNSPLGQRASQSHQDNSQKLRTAIGTRRRNSLRKERKSRSINTDRRQLNDTQFFNDNLSEISGDTIENFSIFDFKRDVTMEEPVTTSESSLSKPKMKASEIFRRRASSLPKGKERQNSKFILDFKVPIYTKVVKSTVMTQKSEDTTLEDHNGDRSKKAEAFGNHQLSSMKRWPFYDSKQPLTKAERRILCCNCKENIVNNLEMLERKCNLLNDGEEERQEKSFNAMSDNDLDQALSSEDEDEPMNANYRSSVAGGNAEIGLDSSRVENRRENSDTSKLKKSMPDNTRKNELDCLRTGAQLRTKRYKKERDGNKSAVVKVKDLIDFLKRSSNYKRSESTHDVIDPNNASETETDYSLPSTPGTNPRLPKKYNKLYKVEVDCRLCAYDSKEKTRSIHNPDTTTKDTSVKKEEKCVAGADELQIEKEKSLKKTKTSRLPKIFTNIVKKQAK